MTRQSFFARQRLSRAESAALVIGFGMGGLFDFLVLHLILQWHHMISHRVSMDSLGGLQINNFWDGIGEAAMWLITFGGIFLLFSARAQPVRLRWRRFVGLLILGWGVFNLIDGVFNHHVFALHNVRDDVVAKDPWNMAFMLIFGVAQSFCGWWVARMPR